jgi:hypothetical protein
MAAPLNAVEMSIEDLEILILKKQQFYREVPVLFLLLQSLLHHISNIKSISNIQLVWCLHHTSKFNSNIILLLFNHRSKFNHKSNNRRILHISKFNSNIILLLFNHRSKFNHKSNNRRILHSSKFNNKSNNKSNNRWFLLLNRLILRSNNNTSIIIFLIMLLNQLYIY